MAPFEQAELDLTNPDDAEYFRDTIMSAVANGTNAPIVVTFGTSGVPIADVILKTLIMIAPQKMQNGLYAMHGMLVKARALSRLPQCNQELTTTLSKAEVLMTMFASKTDETAAFRKMLEREAASEKWEFILHRFDCTDPWSAI